jgi:uncharacterized protein YggE
MTLRNALAVFLCFASSALQGQSLVRSSYVRAFGQATVSVKPDLARVQFSVVTQASTAQDASSQNATRTSSVLSQLQTLLGPNADILTVGYSMSPNYSYPPAGGAPTLIGYTVSNTIRVTTSDLSTTGRIIDTGIQAGATQVAGLQFGLKDDQPVRAQALRLATVQAKAHADAMAAGAGMHSGGFRSIEEGISVKSGTLPVAGVSAATSTPIVTGLVDIDASVTIEVDLVP